MKKRIFIIFLAMLLAITNMGPAYANGVEGLTDINLNTETWQPALDSQFSSYNNEQVNDTWLGQTGQTIVSLGSGIIKVIIDILSFIPTLFVHALLAVIGLIVPAMDQIIFNDATSLWGTFFRLSYFDTAPMGFASHMVNFVSVVYQIFRYVALIGFVVAIACIAVKMIISSVGKQKAQYKESLKNWMIGLVLLVVGHWIMIYSIYFSDYLVNLICNVKEQLAISFIDYGEVDNVAGGVDATLKVVEETVSSLTNLGQFSLVSTFSDAVGSNAATAMAPLAALPQLAAVLGILWAIMAIIGIIIFIAMNLKIVKVYLERVIVVGILIMIFPLVTVFYAFEKGGIKKGSTFETWLRTFTDQVFIQPIHALTLLGVCIALNAVAETVIVTIPIIGMIVVLMVLNTMFTIENVIKRVFAINGAGLGSPINPVGAAMAGAGIAASTGKHLKKAGGKAIFTDALNAARSAGKGKIRSGLAGVKAIGKEAGKFALGSRRDGISKMGMRNLKTLGSLVGVSVSDDFFDVDKLSQKEQRDATKHLKRAAATKDMSKVAGAKLRTDVKNLEFMADPTITAVTRRKFGIDEDLLDRVLLHGLGSDSDQLRVRAYLQSLADPSTDVSDLIKDDGTGNYVDNGFDYYVSSSDERVKTDLGMVGKLNVGDVPDGRVINARKTHELKHAEEAEVIKSTLGLDDAKIAAVEDGSATDPQDVLAYELYIKKCENPAINIDACGTPGHLEANMVHNIDMSESKMKDNVKAARTVTRGTAVDPDVVTTRKVYEATHPKEARKIRSECPLSDGAIAALEAGHTSYGSHTFTDDDLLAYKVMVDRMGTGRKLDEYTDSSGKISGAIYNGITMETPDRFSEATDLYMHSSDMLNASSADSIRARTVLASFRAADESSFYAKVASKGVAANDMAAFIEGDLSKISSQAQIIGILRELATK